MVAVVTWEAPQGRRNSHLQALTEAAKELGVDVGASREGKAFSAARKRKHHWTEAFAGFVDAGGERVGKCPVGISAEQAEELLNTQAVEYHNPRAPGPAPDRLYVIHEGVVYRAVPTVAGVSFHAFPDLPERLRVLPKPLRRRIIELAERLGCREEVERWIAG